MLHVVDDYYIKRYGKNLILLKKKPQKNLENDITDDDIDEETGGVIYDAKHYKRLGYFANVYSALLALDKVNSVENFDKYESFEQFLSSTQVFRDEILSFYKRYTEESLKNLHKTMVKNSEETKKEGDEVESN